jgi:hypothetical protein
MKLYHMIVLASRTDGRKYDQKLLIGFGDISGQRSKRSKTLEISNKSTVQARTMILGAFDRS